MLRNPLALILATALSSSAIALPQAVESSATSPFVNYESGPVNPLLLSPNGERLYVLNTPDHRVEIYAVDLPGDLNYQGSVLTGLEPVAMALHPNDPNRLFVANHLSDTVSVVDLAARRVLDTIDVGDEPQGLAIAQGKLFVATSRSAPNASLVLPGAFIENAVVVTQIDAPYDVLDRVGIPGHKPRALAVQNGRVLVVPLNSGNNTTALNESQTTQLGIGQLLMDNFDAPFEFNPALASLGLLGANFTSNFGVNGWRIPRTARIVFDFEYQALVPQLADSDVIALDASTHALLPPHIPGVGTTLFDIVVNPVTGHLWIPNTESLNRTRFEPNLKGRAFENRISIITGGPMQLLKLAPPLTSKEHAQPTSVAFYDGPRGQFAYVLASGTNSLIVFDALTGTLVAELVTGPVPSGLAVDAGRDLLYVHSRGDGAIRAYDIAGGHAPLTIGGQAAKPFAYDPEPAGLRKGRKHLYDARVESGAGTGNFGCAGCHVFGHTDGLAWDLGDPGGGLGYFFPELLSGVLSLGGQSPAAPRAMMTHPMKGPMVTQSFRGIGERNMAPLHWRGDRRFFQMFRGAFGGLLGGSGISEAEMQEFAVFIDSLRFGPNPHQPKDRQYRGGTQNGHDVFGMNPNVPGKEYNALIPGNVTCIDCHKGDFTNKTDFSGAQTTVNFDGEPQMFNTAALRGAYEKEFRDLTGFGLLHDGSVPSIQGFLDGAILGVMAFPNLTPTERVQVADFVRAWDTGTPPSLGSQISADGTNAAEWNAWLDLAEAQVMPPADDVDLIARGVFRPTAGGELPLGLFYRERASGGFEYAASTGRRVDSNQLRSLIASGTVEVTFTVVPRGMGRRLGIDRDEDGILDGRERWYGTNPADPDSDDDGYDDGLEKRLGTDPSAADAQIAADTRAPQIQDHRSKFVFATSASLDVLLDEPGSVTVDVGLTSGVFTLASFNSVELRAKHDLVLFGLPASTMLFYRVTARDKNGNTSESEGSFETAAALYHIDEITLQVSGSGPYTLTATVKVVDSTGTPIDGIPVRGIWFGPNISAGFFPLQNADANGVATFTRMNYSPGSTPADVTFSPAYVGAAGGASPWYVGAGGSVPEFFYNQSANRENFRTITLP